MKRFFGILFFLGGLFLALGGYLQMAWQHRANTAFTPTPAWIDHVEVVEHRGSKGSRSYEPAVSYHYTVNGVLHNSKRVLPFDENGDSSWANAVVAPFKYKITLVELPNDKPPAIAYVNPDNPDESILVRQYSFSPNLLLMLSLLGAAIGVGMITGFFRAARTEMTAIAVDESDARLLMPTVNLKGRFKGALGMLVATCLITLPPFYHWIFVAHQFGATAGSWTATIISGITLLIVLTLTLRRWSVSRHISDARLRVRPVPMLRGQPFEIELEADAFTLLRVKEARCVVVCVEHYKERRGNKTQYGTRTRQEHKLILCTNVDVPADQVVSGKGTVQFDDSIPPTSDAAARKSFPYYTWEARVAIELTGAVDYAGVFPIDVL